MRKDHLIAGPHWTPTRRGFLGSALGAILANGFHLSSSAAPPANDRSVIVLWMRGGQSHIDSFDPKTGSKEAGEFGQIQTRIPGVQFTDRLPKLAAIADKLTVLRSVVGEESEHNRAQYYANTGFRPLASMDAPGIGSVVSHELGPVPMKRADRSGLASFVAINENPWAGPGYLGLEHSAFMVYEPKFGPQNLGTREEALSPRFQQRAKLLSAFDENNGVTGAHPLTVERQRAREQAIAMMLSPKQSAFDLKRASPALRAAYGDGKFGQGCLMARQLIAAGVRFVEVHLDGWDSHVDNFKTQARLLTELDGTLSTLIRDLEEHGLLEQTLIVCMGEFGRTPHINPRGGRDHHAACWSALLAGGCIRTGQVYGETSPRGSYATKNPVKIPDLLATLFTAVGIDPNKEYTDSGGKPVRLVEKGTAIRALL